MTTMPSKSSQGPIETETILQNAFSTQSNAPDIADPAHFLQQQIEHVDDVRKQLPREPHRQDLEELHRYFLQLAEELSPQPNSTYGSLVERSGPTARKILDQVIDLSFSTAKRLERYASGQERFSRTQTARQFGEISAALNSFLDVILSRDEPAPDPPPKPAPEPTPQPAPEPTPHPAPSEISGVSSMLRQLQADAVDGGAISDQSLRRRADDRLGHGVYVDALRNFISSPDTTTPLTIAIDGPWGSGKTSLMRMVQSELEGTSRGDQERENFSARLSRLAKFYLALPLWLLGTAVLRFDGGTNEHPRWPRIRAGFSFDATCHEEKNIQDWPRAARFWAKVSAWYEQRQPPFHPTIWFNAWKFDQEEQLWAALAVETLRQIKGRYGWIGRFIFWVQLTSRRITPLGAIGAILQRIALPLVPGVLLMLYEPYLQSITTAAGGSRPQIDALLPLGQWLLVAGGLLTAAIQAGKIVKDPFQLSVNDFLRKPDYAAKVGFLGVFEADFAHIVAVATRRHAGWKPQKLVIFIDDLDRCEPPKSVDVIEAINLLLDSERCVFVIGMDAAAVIASVDTKYEKLFEKMRQEAMDVASPGRFFLDKIIQVPFQMPAASDKHIEGLVAYLIEARASRLLALPAAKKPAERAASPVVQAGPTDGGDDSTGESSISPPAEQDRLLGGGDPADPTGRRSTPPPPNPDIASYAREDVQHAIRQGARLLADNPRQIKRFVNVFRLHVYIASQLGLFEEQTFGGQSYGLTLDRLATWVAWSIRWADLSKHLLREAQLQRSWLRDFMASLAKSLRENGSWRDLTEAQADKLPFVTSLSKSDETQAPPESLYQAVVAWVAADRARSSDHAPWLLLPWEWWLLERDFLQGVKSMESFWQRPERISRDWFKTTLLMTRVDFEAVAPLTQNGGISTPSSSGVSAKSGPADGLPSSEATSSAA